MMMSLLLPTGLWAQSKQGEIKITLKNNAAEEAQTRTQLQRLLSQYDLSRYIFTREIVIDRRAIPHSHPVLTLSARHLKDDELLLATFLHEQFHWFLTQREEQTEKAKQELKTIFPRVPAGFPEGARDENSTYLHLLVNTLEHAAIRELLGELKARQVMEFWATDHYTWIYRQVLTEGRKIREVLVKHKLTL
jgi:hypothetical protein